MWSKAHKLFPKRIAGVAAMAVLAAAASGCANSRMTTGSVRSGADLSRMNESQVAGAAAKLGQAYARKPDDKKAAMAYAQALQAQGNADQSLAVMRRLAIAHPKDREVLAAYGKALAAGGELEAALDAVRRAQTPEYPDWRLMSAEATILDQTGQKDDARALYQRALQLKPNEPSVLSNLGMSYLLEGNLQQAETYLASAVRQPGADSRVRQNLALVVGLQGRFDEAERIAGQELSPDQARANVAYLRGMLAQQNSWNQLKDKDGQQASAQ